MIYSCKNTPAEELQDIATHVEDLKEKLKEGNHMRNPTISYLVKYYNLSHEQAIAEIEEFIKN